jgi:hypothetical protein
MNSRTALLVWLALAVCWCTAAAVYLYPDVKEEIEEKRYLHRVERLHTPVLPIECARARGIENRDYVREDTDPNQCWTTIPAFRALFPEIAQGTDLGATLRTQEREELPQDRWDGTPLAAVARATAIVLGPPVLAFGLMRTGRRRLWARGRSSR